MRQPAPGQGRPLWHTTRTRRPPESRSSRRARSPLPPPRFPGQPSNSEGDLAPLPKPPPGESVARAKPALEGDPDRSAIGGERHVSLARHDLTPAENSEGGFAPLAKPPPTDRLPGRSPYSKWNLSGRRSVKS